jgi:hypothetical protein
MDLEKVLDQLRDELHNLEAAIASLEQLQQTSRRRGRPPGWLAAVTKPGRPKKRPRSKSKQSGDTRSE